MPHHGTLRNAVICGRKSENRAHQVWKANDGSSGYKKTYGCRQQKQFQNIWLLPAQKMHTDREVFFNYSADSHVVCRFLIIKLDKTFQQGREEKAEDCPIKDRADAKSRIKNASQERGDEGGDG